MLIIVKKGREDEVKLRILQVEPGKIALEVIVGQQRIGAQTQVIRKGRIGAQVGGLFQRFRSRLQIGPIHDVVGDRFELIATPAHDGGRAVDFRFCVRMIRDIFFDLLAGQAWRIKTAAGRHWLLADEGLVFIDQVEPRSVDPEITAQLYVARVFAVFQGLVQREGVGIDLAPINAVEVLAGVDEFADHFSLVWGQVVREWHFHWAKTRDALGYVRDHFHVRGFGRFGCRAY